MDTDISSKYKAFYLNFWRCEIDKETNAETSSPKMVHALRLVDFIETTHRFQFD